MFLKEHKSWINLTLEAAGSVGTNGRLRLGKDQIAKTENAKQFHVFDDCSVPCCLASVPPAPNEATITRWHQLLTKLERRKSEASSEAGGTEASILAGRYLFLGVVMGYTKYWIRMKIKRFNCIESRWEHH